MSAPATPASVPDLDDLVRGVTPARRSVAVQRIGKLFADGSDRFRPAHIEVFDAVLGGLLPATDLPTRADLAERLAPLANAPPALVATLAHDSEVAVAGPVLQRSPLIDVTTLVEIARSRGQGHLLAIARRDRVAPAVTDVLVRRGERDVARTVAGNGGAMFSDAGYAEIVRRAGADGLLAVAVGRRDDLSPAHLRDIVAVSADVVRRRLFQQAPASRRADIAKVMVEIGAAAPLRDFTAAKAAVLALHGAAKLDAQALTQFARERKHEEVVATLAAMSGLPLAAVERILVGERRDSVLILGRALGLDWPAVQAVAMLRLPAGRTMSPMDVETARNAYERIAWCSSGSRRGEPARLRQSRGRRRNSR
jgi:uncharacterized protein (DUF2336 family)